MQLTIKSYPYKNHEHQQFTNITTLTLDYVTNVSSNFKTAYLDLKKDLRLVDGSKLGLSQLVMEYNKKLLGIMPHIH